MQNLKIVVPEEKKGERIDKFLAESLTDFTRSAIQKWLIDGNVKKENFVIPKNYRVNRDDVISVFIPDPVTLEVRPESIPLQIVYEDEDLLVVNKPKGMVVHPAAGNYDGTLVNALLWHCGSSLSGINGVIRPGIVHRIDKDTSGLLIVAKNDFAHQGLAEQIKTHSFKREYEAVVYGNLKEEHGTVDAPIGRCPTDRKKMAITEKNSKHAVTHFEVVQRYHGFTHVRLQLETGRTHQIRVHMASLGHPVAGDTVYGPKKAITFLHGQCLHAKVIGFHHPRDGRYIELNSELPDYFVNFLNTLKKDCGYEDR